METTEADTLDEDAECRDWQLAKYVATFIGLGRSQRLLHLQASRSVIQSKRI